jgi:ABC-type phosphate/phosphonate transport system substrate-binding protein
MTYHDYPLTLEERLENAFLSFNKEEEVDKVINELTWKYFNA